MTSRTAFTIHAGSLGTAAGLSLRGFCDSPAAAHKLEQSAAEIIGRGLPCIWVDCQRLLSVSAHGQRAMYNAHQWAQQAATSLYWCGFGSEVQAQLSETGLHLLLSLLPATGYRGPAVLLQDPVPAVQYARQFTA